MNEGERREGESEVDYQHRLRQKIRTEEAQILRLGSTNTCQQRIE